MLQRMYAYAFIYYHFAIVISDLCILCMVMIYHACFLWMDSMPDGIMNRMECMHSTYGYDSMSYGIMNGTYDFAIFGEWNAI